MKTQIHKTSKKNQQEVILLEYFKNYIYDFPFGYLLSFLFCFFLSKVMYTVLEIKKSGTV